MTGRIGPPGAKGKSGADGLKGLPGKAINTDGTSGGRVYSGELDPRFMTPQPILEVGDMWVAQVNWRWDGSQWKIRSAIPIPEEYLN